MYHGFSSSWGKWSSKSLLLRLCICGHDVIFTLNPDYSAEESLIYSDVQKVQDKCLLICTNPQQSVNCISCINLTFFGIHEAHADTNDPNTFL